MKEKVKISPLKIKLLDQWLDFCSTCHEALEKSMRNRLVKVPKTIRGVILYFGSVETQRVSPLILTYKGTHDSNEGFHSLKESPSSLAHYLFEDYVYGLEDPVSVIGFQEYLRGIPCMDASAGNSFDAAHVNGEEWWAWDQVKQLSKWFKYFVQISENAEYVLTSFLDSDRVKSILTKNKLFMRNSEEWRAERLTSFEEERQGILDQIDSRI